MDHAEVAVQRFRRVHEIGRRAGACHRRGDLARDVAGLAETADDDATRAVQNQADSLRERVAETAGKCVERARLDVEYTAGDGQCVVGRGRRAHVFLVGGKCRDKPVARALGRIGYDRNRL